MGSNQENPATANFREYLRIKTDEPNPDYASCIQLLTRLANELQLPYKTFDLVPGYPVFYMKWEGVDPTLPSLVLNSHMDVVPIYPESWHVDAWSAIKKENGDIFGRGTQDMKSCGIQHIEAIRKLKSEGHRFKRNIFLLFIPDEEYGAYKGMRKFIATDDFEEMKAGFVLDEGLANPTEEFTVFFGERCPWWMKVRCPGNPGHGSRFIQDTAAEKIRKIINRFLDFRKEQEDMMTDKCMQLGEVTTVNLTLLEGGVAFNVVPADMSVGFDIRVPPTLDLKEFERKMVGWIKECGDDITYDFFQQNKCQTLTPTNVGDPWWDAFHSGCEQAGIKYQKSIFPAATDSRFLRELGIPCLGFSPMNNTPILLHDHNEFLNEKIFLMGIDIFTHIIPKLANVKMY